MKKGLLFTMAALLACFASFAIDPITGSPSSCMGSTGHVYDSTAGGVWSSSNTAIASINSSTGVIHGVSAGSATITYTVGSAYVTYAYTVNPAVAAITGAGYVCMGASTTLADATAGGTWSSSNPSAVTVSAAGVVTPLLANSGVIISYSTGAGCTVTAGMSTLGTIAAITGATTVCPGSTITLSDTSSGGTWSSSNTSVATVVYGGPGTWGGTYGTVTGVTPGTATIIYTTSGVCGTFTATYVITVTTGVTTPAAITGPSTVSAGGTIALSDATVGGTWSMSPSTVATINPTTGIVSGVAAGTATATYTMTGCGGATAIATYPVTVTAFTGISGHINFLSTPYYGPVKIWMITYVSPILTAIDSVTVYAAGSSVYYEFASAPTDSIRIKASVDSTAAMGTGYIPTYHISSFYWNAANVFYHASGTASLNKDINMLSGTVTTGPGFIGGDVTTGANKGTTSSVPVENLIMYVFNSSTMQLMQSVRTDATGHYSFSNLPVGATYIIFPDSLNYTTTPYTSIALTAGSPSMSAASFIQHTLSMTITPIPVGVTNVSAATASILAFPNPTNGKVNIMSQLPTAQTAAVTVADVTGHVVYSSNINMASGASSNQIDLSSLTNGLYTISVKSASVNYNNKIQVQH